jgi:hypothetical protein
MSKLLNSLAVAAALVLANSATAQEAASAVSMTPAIETMVAPAAVAAPTLTHVITENTGAMAAPNALAPENQTVKVAAPVKSEVKAKIEDAKPAAKMIKDNHGHNHTHQAAGHHHDEKTEAKADLKKDIKADAKLEMKKSK